MNINYPLDQTKQYNLLLNETNKFVLSDNKKEPLTLRGDHMEMFRKILFKTSDRLAIILRSTAIIVE